MLLPLCKSWFARKIGIFAIILFFNASFAYAFKLKRDLPAEPVPDMLVDEGNPDYKDTFTLNKIILSGNRAFNQKNIIVNVSKYFNTAVSINDIQNIAKLIQDFYFSQGFVSVEVIIPKQNIKDGVLKISVYEGKINEVIFRDVTPKGFKSYDELEQLQNKELMKTDLEDPLLTEFKSYRKIITEKNPIQSKDIEKYILLIKRIYGVEVQKVSLVKARWGNYGNSQLIIIYKKKIFSIDATYGNYYTSQNTITNDQRISEFTENLNLSTTFYNVLNYTDKLNFNFWTIPNFTDIRTYNASYTTGIGRSGLSLTLYYENFFDDSQHLRHNLYGTVLSYPLILKDFFQLESYGRVNYLQRDETANLSDYHSTYLALGIKNVFAKGSLYNTSNFEIIQGLKAASGRFSGNYMNYNPGFLKFTYYQNLTYTFPIFYSQKCLDSFKSTTLSTSEEDAKNDMCTTYNGNFLIASKGQYSSETLLPSDYFVFGGAEFGRGYAVNALSGDTGFAAKAELRLNYGVSDNNFFLSLFQPYVFYDFSYARFNKTKSFTDYIAKQETSTGVGLKTYFKQYFLANIFVAKKLSEKDNKYRPFFLLSFSLP